MVKGPRSRVSRQADDGQHGYQDEGSIGMVRVHTSASLSVLEKQLQLLLVTFDRIVTSYLQ